MKTVKTNIACNNLFSEENFSLSLTFQIESEPIFKVEGMLPIMQYRFMVTAVGPGGRLGGPIMSNWAQSLTVDEELNTRGKTKNIFGK